MEYDKKIKEITSTFDLKQDTQKKKAYEACIEYADKKFGESLDYNPFVNRAAEFLGLVPICKGVIQNITPVNGSELVHLSYSKENETILAGNKSGLKYLGKLFENLSKSKLDGEHIHLWSGEFPLVEGSYSLTLYHENDEWFKKNAKVKKEKTANDNKEVPRRNISENEIVSLAVVSQIPPIISMTTLKMYKIKKCTKFKEQKVWQKEIRDNKDRMFVFTFLDDEGKEIEFAFDLDDKEIFFLKQSDL